MFFFKQFFLQNAWSGIGCLEKREKFGRAIKPAHLSTSEASKVEPGVSPPSPGDIVSTPPCGSCEYCPVWPEPRPKLPAPPPRGLRGGLPPRPLRPPSTRLPQSSRPLRREVLNLRVEKQEIKRPYLKEVTPRTTVIKGLHWKQVRSRLNFSQGYPSSCPRDCGAK